MAAPLHISGFSVIPVYYNSTATHYLYARSHFSTKGKHKNDASSRKQNDLPDGRTLFLVNVPPDATERELVLFFKHAGTVEKIIFDSETTNVHNEVVESEDEDGDEDVLITESRDKDASESSKRSQSRKRRGEDAESIPKVIPLPTPSPSLRKLHRTGHTAHVVFLDASSLERALASTSKPRPWPSSSEQPHGLAHYTALYLSRRPSLASIRAFADSSIEVHEYNLQKEKQKYKYKKGEAIVDDDGFTLVTRGGTYGKTLGGGVGVASKQFQRSTGQPRNRGAKKEKEGFYAFQKAERQRAGIFLISCVFVI